MRRSEKIYHQARHEALLSVMFSAMSVAGCVWAVRAWLSVPAGGLAAFALSLIALFPAAAHARECSRLLNMAKRESDYEARRSIRPRI